MAKLVAAMFFPQQVSNPTLFFCENSEVATISQQKNITAKFCFDNNVYGISGIRLEYIIEKL